MSAIANPKGNRFIIETEASAYDKLSSFLVAAIALLGVLAFIMFLIWLTMIMPDRADEVELIALPPGIEGEDKPKGEQDDVEEPGVEEFPEVPVPQLADAVEAVTDVPSSFRGQLATVDGSAAEMGKGRGFGSIDGGGTGGGGSGYERWVINYESDNIGAYVAQLQHFGVQIGAVSKTTPQIDLISNIDGSPTFIKSSRDREKRVYFAHSNSRLKSWDQRFAKKAGSKTTGKIMVQFYPSDVAQQLAQLELNAAKAEGITDMTDIRRTTFKVRSQGSGFEYYVEKIEKY